VTIGHAGDNRRRVLVGAVDAVFGVREHFETSRRNGVSTIRANHLLILSRYFFGDSQGRSFPMSVLHVAMIIPHIPPNARNIP